MRFKEIWIKYGASNKIRFIAGQKLSVVLREMKYKSIINQATCSIWVWCNKQSWYHWSRTQKSTSKFSERIVGKNDSDIQNSYQEVEKYLIKVRYNRAHGSSFDKLR